MFYAYQWIIYFPLRMQIEEEVMIMNNKSCFLQLFWQCFFFKSLFEKQSKSCYIIEGVELNSIEKPLMSGWVNDTKLWNYFLMGLENLTLHPDLDKVRRSGGISCYFSENYFSGCLLAHWELKFWPAKGVVCSIQVSEFLFCFQLLKPESTSIKKCVKTKKNDDFMSFLCRFSHFEL